MGGFICLIVPVSERMVVNDDIQLIFPRIFFLKKLFVSKGFELRRKTNSIFIVKNLMSLKLV